MTKIYIVYNFMPPRVESAWSTRELAEVAIKIYADNMGVGINRFAIITKTIDKAYND